MTSGGMAVHLLPFRNGCGAARWPRLPGVRIGRFLTTAGSIPAVLP